MNSPLPAVEAMLAELDEGAIAELERALSLRLHPAPTPAERRVAELGLLAELLAEASRPDAEVDAAPRLKHEAYERRRLVDGSTAPTADTLAARYGSWHRACRAAYGLLPDGRHVGPGKPWRSPTRERRRVEPYTREEVHAAIRACALELGRVPGSGDYHWWSREKRRLLRGRGVELETSILPEHRTPGIEALYRHYPRGTAKFRQALRDARLNEVEIAVVRARRLLRSLEVAETANGPLAALRKLSADTDAIDADTRARIEKDGFGWLNLGEALRLARVLGGSLDWLAGRSAARGGPPEGDRFDHILFSALAAERKLSGKQIRAKLDLPPGPYRRLMRGADHPVLAELAILASLAHVDMNDLLPAETRNPSPDRGGEQCDHCGIADENGELPG